MKRIILKSIMFLLMAIFTGITFFACNDDDEKEERKTDSIRIEGKIVGVLDYREGNRIVISVTNKENFGKSGTYYRYISNDTLHYNNAIGLPLQELLSVLPMQESLPVLDIGTEIIFDCRQALPEDYESIFGDTISCLAIYEPLMLPDYVVIKVINIKNRKE